MIPFRRLRMPLLTWLIVGLVLLAVPRQISAQETTGAVHTGGDCFLGVVCDNPGDWLREQVSGIVSDFVSGIVHGFGDALTSFLNDVNFVTRTPESLSYNNALVAEFASATQVLANALLATAALVTGFNIMFRPYLGWVASGANAALPRLVLGAILINTAAWWVRLAIDVNNAACVVFGAPNLADLTATLLRVAGEPITGLLMGLIVVIMGLLLVLQQLMRLALVNVLVILAPLAALCWTVPQAQSWARRWGVLFVGTVFAQAVQVLTLHLGFSLTTDLPPLSAAGVLLQPFLGIAVLALTLRIPGLMSGGGGGGTIVGDLLGTAAGAAVGASVGIAVRGAMAASGAVNRGGKR